MHVKPPLRCGSRSRNHTSVSAGRPRLTLRRRRRTRDALSEHLSWRSKLILVKSRRVGVLGWIAIIVFVPIAIVTFATGWIHDGWQAETLQCLIGPYPTTGGPFHESTIITGQATFLPLGLDCTYDAPGDGFGPQTVHNYRFDSTLVLVISLFAVVRGALLIRRARRIEQAVAA